MGGTPLGDPLESCLRSFLQCQSDGSYILNVQSGFNNMYSTLAEQLYMEAGSPEQMLQKEKLQYKTVYQASAGMILVMTD